MAASVRTFFRAQGRVVEIVAIPVLTAAGFWILSTLELIAGTPVWVLVGLIVFGAAGNEWVRHRHRQAVRVRIVAQTAVTAAVIYATGWGPVLAIGFMYPIAASVRTFGSKAARPAFVTALLAVAVGQTCVALDLAPTLLSSRLSHGLSVLGVLGMAFPTWVIYSTSAKKEASEEQLAHQAFYDPLSELPNRTLFVDRLGEALTSGREQGRMTAVLFVDLDRFKVVNDSLGHEVGDMLLAGVGLRIQGCVRPDDVVARLGGDEFTVLLQEVTEQSDAVRVAERILESLKEPFNLSGFDVAARASIGIAVSPHSKAAAEDLVRDADLAMYQAKRKGGSRYELFDSDMAVRALRRIQLEGRLRRAIDEQEFSVAYQPEVDLRTGRVAGAEALFRWSDPVGSVVPLSDVIGLAEETGLILPLGAWVMEEAARSARRWFEAQTPGATTEHQIVAVNISGRQFQSELARQLRTVLRTTGLPPERLRVEITESAVMQDVEHGMELVGEIKDLGVQIAIDDFGTGHSSLSYLNRFPADVLKLDRSFVARLGTDDDALAIVEAVVTMGHRLGMKITAEGVETVTQVEHLRALGCDTCQGYLFSPPVSGDDIAALLWHARYPVDNLASMKP